MTLAGPRSGRRRSGYVSPIRRTCTARSANCAYDLAPQGGFPAPVREEPEPGEFPVPVLGVVCQDPPGRVARRAAGKVDHTVGILEHRCPLLHEGHGAPPRPGRSRTRGDVSGCRGCYRTRGMHPAAGRHPPRCRRDGSGATGGSSGGSVISRREHGWGHESWKHGCRDPGVWPGTTHAGQGYRG